MGSAVLVLAGSWCAGIVVGTVAPLPVVVLLVGLAIVAGAAALAPTAALRLVALAMASALIGQARPEPGRSFEASVPLESYAGDVMLRGRVVEAPLPRGNRFESVVEVDAIGEASASTPISPLDSRPRVLLRANWLRAAYGDLIETRGRLSRPRSRPGWPLAEMLARRQIYWVLDSGGARVIEPAAPSLVGLLTAARGIFEANTRAVLPEPHASLLAGMVFGARVGLPPELRTAMSATGTSHLTAVSGANVAMVAGALILIASCFAARLPAALLAVAGVWLYTLLVGMPPSALRAATMATFALVAHGLGRQTDAIVGLALAVAVLLGWDPGLAFDLGFQLSVTATAGLILLSPSIEGRLGLLPSWLRAHVAVAIAAQVATLPLIVGTFQRLSLVSLPANVLAAPLVAPIMGIGVVIALIGSIPGLGSAVGWLAWLATSALLFVIETAAVLPGAVVAVGQAPAWLPLAWYAVLGCWVAAGSADFRQIGIRPAALKAAALLGAGLMTILAVVGWPGDRGSGGVQVVLLDTEPAAAFVRTQAGMTALVMSSSASRGVGASVGALLDLSESSVDVELSPAGLRTAVDLLALGTSAGSRLDAVGGPEVDPDVTDAPASNPLLPGTEIELADRVRLNVVDVREASGRQVVDLAIHVEGFTILLPGPGTPSTRWKDVPPEAVSVAALPASAVSWARTLPPRNWLLLVGEPAQERARGESGVPFLARREAGSVELIVRHGAVKVRTERCSTGRDCVIELPPPAIRTLLVDGPVGDTSGGRRSPVQSGRIGDGR